MFHMTTQIGAALGQVFKRQVLPLQCRATIPKRPSTKDWHGTTSQQSLELCNSKGFIIGWDESEFAGGKQVLNLCIAGAVV